MKIAFVSVRGIPNNYGGFEQFAEYISVGLAKRGHDVRKKSTISQPQLTVLYLGMEDRFKCNLQEHDKMVTCSSLSQL